jgi:HlyD family secretion protein
MKKKKIAIVGLIVAAVALAGGTGWYFWNQNVSSTDEEKVYVTTISTLMGDVSGTQNRYAGIVEPQNTVSVKVESGRKVGEVKVEEGDKVKKGDLLFTYDATDSQDKLEEAKLDLERLKNEETSIQSQIETLNKEKTTASADEQLSYTIEIKTEEMNLKKNQYDQQTKAAEIEKLEAATEDLEVTSDIDGVIKSINTSATSSSDDDTYYDSSDSSSDSSSFITIVATGNYRVKGTINETNIGSISVGDEIIIRSRVDSDKVWNGTIESINTKDAVEDSSESYYDDGDSDEQTTSSSYPFYVSLEDSTDLMLGQHVFIELDNGQTQAKDGVWLDEYYIVDADTNPYVWASDSRDRLEKREVTLGEYDENLGQYEILDGLTKNDCIAFPDESYEEGMKTTINEEAQTVSSGLDEEYLGDEENLNNEEYLDNEEFDSDDFDSDEDFDSEEEDLTDDYDYEGAVDISNEEVSGQ